MIGEDISRSLIKYILEICVLDVLVHLCKDAAVMFKGHN